MKHLILSIVLMYLKFLGAVLAAEQQKEFSILNVEHQKLELGNKESPKQVICEIVNEDFSFHADYTCHIDCYYNDYPSSDQKIVNIPFSRGIRSVEVTMSSLFFYLHFRCSYFDKMSSSTLLFHSNLLQPDTYKVTAYLFGDAIKFMNDQELDVYREEFYCFLLQIYKLLFARDDNSLFSIFPQDVKNEIMNQLLTL